MGWDLSDPAAYRDVGIDPAGRMGAALISARAEVGAFFFTLSDEGKFIEMVRSKAGQRQITLTTKEYGPSTLLASDKELSIVVRTASPPWSSPTIRRRRAVSTTAR